MNRPRPQSSFPSPPLPSAPPRSDIKSCHTLASFSAQTSLLFLGASQSLEEPARTAALPPAARLLLRSSWGGRGSPSCCEVSWLGLGRLLLLGRVDKTHLPPPADCSQICTNPTTMITAAAAICVILPFLGGSSSRRHQDRSKQLFLAASAAACQNAAHVN